MPRSVHRALGGAARAAGGRGAQERGAAPAASAPFHMRESFLFPPVTPTWYIGHMHRAMRSLPSLLARHPPPLVVEVRDARLPLTSINPHFEEVLQNAPSAGQRVALENGELVDGWVARRLIVYTKRDLVDSGTVGPVRRALEEHTHGQRVMFVDTRRPSDVRRVYNWACERATQLSKAAASAASMGGPGSRHRSPRLSGAARHTPTPETGVRLLVVGMPNVGKSALLNALRFAGTGRGRAASTHPHPGHTRKVTGTVRITPAPPSLAQLDAAGQVDMKQLVAAYAQRGPAIYVYDTPGIMVPYLGPDATEGPERALKLGIIGCIKQSLFDPETLVDYLLYRMNQRYAAALESAARRGAAPPPPPPYAALLRGAPPTDDCRTFLQAVAEVAPGARQRGGAPNLALAAEYVLDLFRKGRLGPQELDLSGRPPAQAYEHVQRYQSDALLGASRRTQDL